MRPDEDNDLPWSEEEEETWEGIEEYDPTTNQYYDPFEDDEEDDE